VKGYILVPAAARDLVEIWRYIKKERSSAGDSPSVYPKAFSRIIRIEKAAFTVVNRPVK